MPEDRLYFFQFPSPFPQFVSRKAAAMDVDVVPDATKKVSFAPDVKPELTPASSRTASVVPSEVEATKAVPLDGVIGRLEVYKSGAVKIRLADGILLDVCCYIVFTGRCLFSYFLIRSNPRRNHPFCSKLSFSIKKTKNFPFWAKSISNLWYHPTLMLF